MANTDLLTRFNAVGRTESAIHDQAATALQSLVFALTDRIGTEPTLDVLRAHLAYERIQDLLTCPTVSRASRSFVRAYLSALEVPDLRHDTPAVSAPDAHIPIQVYLTQALTLMES